MKTCGLRKKSLLVVDDNQGIQDTVSSIAEEIGFSVTCVGNRTKAIELIDRQAFDVAIVDKCLVEYDKSNADGLAVLKSLNVLNEHTYKILITGAGEYHDALEAQKYEVDKLMEKRSDPLEIAGDLRDSLRIAIEAPCVGHDVEDAVSLFSSEKDPSVWMDRVSTLLKPTGSVDPLIESIERLVRTCAPLQKSSEFVSVLKLDAIHAVSGLFWSRGIGKCCILTLRKNEHLEKDEFPQCDTWPDIAKVGDTLYKAKNSNIYSTVLRCTGMNHDRFSVVCK